MRTGLIKIVTAGFVALGLASCANRGHGLVDESFTDETPEDRAAYFAFEALDTGALRPITMWATYYTIPIVDTRRKGVPLLSIKGHALGPRIGKKDWCRAAMQGSVLVRKRGELETYNFAAVHSKQQVDCTRYYPRHGKIGGTRFKRAKGLYGDGALGWPLVPYRTIAVDPKYVPFGAVVYIPEARGEVVELPDGRRMKHDGYFFAGNTGGSIDGGQIDVFIGPSSSNPFEFVKSTRKHKFKAYVVPDEDIRRGIRALHGLDGSRGD